jgi:MFS family permease
VASRVHYGWLIAVVLFLSYTLTVGISQYAFGVFVRPLEAEFGWTRAQMNTALALFAVGGVIAPFLGVLLDRIGSRIVIMVSLVLLSVSQLLRPWMTELWHFYALSFIMYAGIPGAIMLPVGKLIGIWFESNRGRALGLTAMGANFGGFVFSTLTASLIGDIGWRQTYFVYGLLFIALIPLIFLVIRETPRKKQADAHDGHAPAAKPMRGLSAKAALRTRAFVFVAISLFFANLSYQSVLTQIVPHLENVGFEPTIAALGLSAMAVFGMMGKVSFGYLTEKVAARYAVMVSLGFQIVGLVILVTAGMSPLIWLFVPIFGLAFGGMGSLMPLVVQDTFGNKAFGGIFGMLNFFMLGSALVGPPLVGLSFDATGSYQTAFLAISGLFAVGAAAMWFAKPPSWDEETLERREEMAKAAT